MLEFSPKSLTAMSCLNSALAHHAISSYLLFCCEIILPLCENVENLISTHHHGPKLLKVSRAVYRINTVIKMIWREICQPASVLFQMKACSQLSKVVVRPSRTYLVSEHSVQTIRPWMTDCENKNIVTLKI